MQEQPDYSQKSIDTLIRIADTNLKQLRTTNKELEQMFEKSQGTQDFALIKEINYKWPCGINTLQTLAKVSEQLQARIYDDESKMPTIKKMDIKYKEHKEQFEEILRRIKNSSVYMSQIERRPNNETNKKQELQQELLEDVDVREVIDMQDFVNERDRNIQEISRALNVVHTMSNQMLQLTISDGLKLEGIIKQHKQHQETVEKEILPEVQKTQDVSHKQYKQACFFGIIAMVLALCIVGLVYQIRKNG